MKTVPKKILANKLLHLKINCLNDASVMLYNHVTSEYMRERAREEILNRGDLNLAIKLCILANVKDEHGPKAIA